MCLVAQTRILYGSAAFRGVFRCQTAPYAELLPQTGKRRRSALQGFPIQEFWNALARRILFWWLALSRPGNEKPSKPGFCEAGQIRSRR